MFTATPPPPPTRPTNLYHLQQTSTQYAGMWVGKNGSVKRGEKNQDQHQYFTSGHSTPKRDAIANTVLWLSLTSLQASYSLSTPSAQVIFFSRYVSRTLYFSPVSVHNTLHLHSAELCVVLNRQRLEILLLFVCCGVHIL